MGEVEDKREKKNRKRERLKLDSQEALDLRLEISRVFKIGVLLHVGVWDSCEDIFLISKSRRFCVSAFRVKARKMFRSCMAEQSLPDSVRDRDKDLFPAIHGKGPGFLPSHDERENVFSLAEQRVNFRTPGGSSSEIQ